MKKHLLVVVTMGSVVAAFSACSNDASQRAQQIKDQAQHQANAIKEESEQQAAALKAQAAGAVEQGKLTADAVQKHGEQTADAVKKSDDRVMQHSKDHPKHQAGRVAGVRDAQRSLKDKGFYHGKIDGVAGRGTHQAIRDFQRKNDLAVTGKLDHTTLDRLGS